MTAILVSHRIWLVALGTFLVNLPFGYWRGGLRKFSLKWFAAIHAPVPLVVAMRVLAGIPFRLVALPILVIAFFAGQQCGAHVRKCVRKWRSAGRSATR